MQWIVYYKIAKETYNKRGEGAKKINGRFVIESELSDGYEDSSIFECIKRKRILLPMRTIQILKSLVDCSSCFPSDKTLFHCSDWKGFPFCTFEWNKTEIETITIETTVIEHSIYIELWVYIEVNESFIVWCHNITTRIPLKESCDHHNLCNITTQFKTPNSGI